MKQDGSPSRQHDTAGEGSIRGEDRPECARQVGFGPLDWFRPQASCDNLIDSPFFFLMMAPLRVLPPWCRRTAPAPANGRHDGTRSVVEAQMNGFKE